MTSRIARFGIAAGAAALALVMAAPTAMAYPPNPQVPVPVAGGTVIIVSQQTAEQATPRKLLQRLDGQRVKVRRLSVNAFVVTKLVPASTYRVQIRIDGKWESLGTTIPDRNGTSRIAAFRVAEFGTYPMRLINPNDPNSPLTFTLVVRRAS
jgi:hypothetical protein